MRRFPLRQYAASVWIVRRDHCLSQPSTFVHAEMRAAAEGDPSLAQFAQFATDSLVAAQRAILAHAMQ